MKTTSIYASIFVSNVFEIEKILKTFLTEQWIHIEQRTVLLYEGTNLSLSVEMDVNSCYMSGEYKGNLLTAYEIICQISHKLREASIHHSIYYQEEQNKIPTGEEYNMSFNG
jgi:hypothetical protein